MAKCGIFVLNPVGPSAATMLIMQIWGTAGLSWDYLDTYQFQVAGIVDRVKEKIVDVT